MPAHPAPDGLKLALELDDIEFAREGAGRGFPMPGSALPPPVFDRVVSTPRKDMKCILVDGGRRCPGDRSGGVDQLRLAPARADLADRSVGIPRPPPIESVVRTSCHDVHAPGLRVNG